MNTATAPSLLLLACLGAANWAGEATPLATTPGFQPAVALAEGHKASVYLPNAYATQPDRTFPVVICQHPGGNPSGDVGKWGPWAERFGVVIIGIHGPANSMASHEKPPIQDGVIRALSASLRLHPHWRWTSGVSGGSADGARFIRRKPADFSGACLVAVNAGPAIKPARAGLAFGIIHGAKDDIIPGLGVLSSQPAAYLAAGSPVRWTLSQMGRHSGGPAGAHEEMLTWLLWTGRLAAGQPEADLSQARGDAAAWATSILAQGDAAKREREATLFLELPTAEVAGRDAIAERWAQDVLTAAAALPAADRLAALHDALAGERWQPTTYGKAPNTKPCWIVTRNHVLRDSGLPLPEPVRAAVAKARDAAAADATAARDWELRKQFRTAVLAEIDAGLNLDLSKAAGDAYAAVAAIEPANRWCSEAAQHAHRLKDYYARKSASTAGSTSEPVNDGGEKAPGAP